MSVEAMSPGLSVSTAPAASAAAAGAVSGEMGFNSISEFSAFGGTRVAGFDQAAFSETFQMPSPTLDSFAGGKFNPDASAFENTQAIWQAPLSREIPEGGKAISDVSPFENTQILWQAPEVNIETQPQDIPEISDYQIFKTVVEPEVTLPQAKAETVLETQKIMDISPAEEIAIEPDAMTKEFSMPDEMVRQTAVTKVREAIKYEETIIAVKEPENIIEKLAVETDEKTADLDPIKNKVIDATLGSEVDIHETTTEVIADSKQEVLVGSTIITEPNIEINPAATSDEMIGENAITKVREAIKYEEVKMGTKEPENEMEKLAVETEKKPTTKTEIITEQTDEKDKEEKEKPPKPNPKPPKLYFEHDTNADETRKTVGLGAIGKVSEKIADEEIVDVTGQDIAEQMPNPQPKEVKSEIAKDKDGSYESLVRQLETAGTIYSASEAKGLIEKLVNENHAVKQANSPSSQQATENEVKKVLGGQNPSSVSS